MPFANLILWYAKVMTQATYLILDAIQREPPDPILPAKRTFTNMTIRGLDGASKNMMRCCKRTYLLLLLLLCSRSTLCTHCCFWAETDDQVNLMSFDNQCNTIIALDNCATNHIFCDENSFHGSIVPMDPIKVMGLGNSMATGNGNVKLAFTGDDGKWHNKMLYNAWY